MGIWRGWYSTRPSLLRLCTTALPAATATTTTTTTAADERVNGSTVQATVLGKSPYCRERLANGGVQVEHHWQATARNARLRLPRARCGKCCSPLFTLRAFLARWRGDGICHRVPIDVHVNQRTGMPGPMTAVPPRPSLAPLLHTLVNCHPHSLTLAPSETLCSARSTSTPPQPAVRKRELSAVWLSLLPRPSAAESLSLESELDRRYRDTSQPCRPITLRNLHSHL